VRIAVLMSGGVDSSAAALLLKEKGYDISGLTMLNWDAKVGDEAAQTARYLGISHQVIDLKQVFSEKVIDYFCNTYEKCQTPNPCVECNRHIKFGVLLDYALTQGFDMVATGHYAQIEFDEKNKRYLLKKAVDSSKDQSYFLYGLEQGQLGRTMFPLGGLSKKEVIEIARQAGITAAENRESQEICFIQDDYQEFIRNRVEYKPGQVVDLSGNILGKHRGLPFYTIGQRRGLGISAGRPVYVIELDARANRLILDDEEYLFHSCLWSKDNNYIFSDNITSPTRVEVKIRYTAKTAEALLEPQGSLLKVKFDRPQRAITPGQSAVYYLGDYVLGGGIIDEVL